MKSEKPKESLISHVFKSSKQLDVNNLHGKELINNKTLSINYNGLNSKLYQPGILVLNESKKILMKIKNTCIISKCVNSF